MTQHYCRTCNAPITFRSKTGLCITCSARVRRAREREEKGLAAKMYTGMCAECGGHIGHSNASGLCRHCVTRKRMAERRATRVQLEAETGEPVSGRTWYDVWEQGDHYEKACKSEQCLCAKCGAKIGKKRGVCCACAGKLSAKANKTRARAKALVRRIFVERRETVICFPKGMREGVK